MTTFEQIKTTYKRLNELSVKFVSDYDNFTLEEMIEFSDMHDILNGLYEKLREENKANIKQ